MREIILIGDYEKLGWKPSRRETIIHDLCPWSTASTGRTDNLHILNSEDVVYRNLVLYQSLMKSSKKTQDAIDKIIEEGTRKYGF